MCIIVYSGSETQEEREQDKIAMINVQKYWFQRYKVEHSVFLTLSSNELFSNANFFF